MNKKIKHGALLRNYAIIHYKKNGFSFKLQMKSI
jgi:hypothetical protein